MKNVTQAIETKSDAGKFELKGNLPQELKDGLETIFDAVADRVEGLKKEHSSRIDQIETVLRRGGGSGRADDFRKDPSPEQKAFQGFLRRGPDSLPEIERKSLTVGDGTAGGYLTTPEMASEIIKNLVVFSPVRQAARVGSMGSSEILIPKRTGRPTARWVGEQEDRTGTQSAYGQAQITAEEMACYIDVSQKLLEDSSFDVEAEIAMDLAEEFARLEGYAFVLGDGVGKPAGLLNDSTVASIHSGSATKIADANGQADGLISAFYDLPAFYRNRASWMMNGTTLGAMRKLKDGQNQYIWQSALAAGQPETILGRPVVETPDMPDQGAGNTPVLIGDIQSAYRIYDRVGISILRDPYTMATEGLVRFHARKRVGADVVKAEALRKVICAA